MQAVIVDGGGSIREIRIPRPLRTPILIPQQPLQIQRRRDWMCKLIDYTFSESALKIHLFIFWLICMAETVSESSSNEDLKSVRIIFGASSIASALIGIIARNVYFFFPMVVYVSFELVRVTFHLYIIWLRIFDLIGYKLFINKQSSSTLISMASTYKDLDSTELYFVFVLYILYPLYYTLLYICLLRVMLDIKIFNDPIARRDQMEFRQNDEVFFGLPPFRIHNRYQHEELVERNVDSPPSYSQVAPNGKKVDESQVSTAKSALTSPPRYSQVEPRFSRLMSRAKNLTSRSSEDKLTPSQHKDSQNLNVDSSHQNSSSTSNRSMSNEMTTYSTIIEETNKQTNDTQEDSLNISSHKTSDKMPKEKN